MSVNDLRITEVMYNPGPSGLGYIEVTNTGSTAVSTNDFFVGNSDFMPEYFDGFDAPNTTIPAGAVLVLVPSLPDFSGEIYEPPVPISQAEFEAVYGPLPAGAIYINYPAYNAFPGDDFIGGGRSYTIGGNDVFADSVYIPEGALEGQSVSIDAEGIVTFGTPTPGSSGVTPPVEGPTEGDDELVGTDGGDEIDGLGGDDSIDGGRGADIINGGAGNDYIEGGRQSDELYGGAGEDEIYGGYGNDLIFGGADDDLLFGGSGNDEIRGGSGDDVLHGDHGKDTLFGGSGDDELYGGASNDRLVGGVGNDTLDGGSGRDRLSGGDGDDVLDGGSQSDRLFGGDGNDQLNGGIGNDWLTGGEGADTFVFAGVTNSDVILDFEVGVDRIDVTDYGPISDADAIAAVSQVGANAVVDLGQYGSITLSGVNATDLSLSDFIYIPDDIFTVG